jgi:hypothetical protein
MRILFVLFLLLGFSYASKAADVPVDTSLKVYAGVYKLAENGFIQTYTVTFDDGKLYGQANGYDKTPLTKQDGVHTFVSGYGSTVIFTYNAEKKSIDQVKLLIQGNEITGTRQE